MPRLFFPTDKQSFVTLQTTARAATGNRAWFDPPARVAFPYFELRNVIVRPARPTTAAAIPPMSIQTALSVGEPVKNRETSELNEFVALMPTIMSTTPPASRARETILFITGFQ